MVGDKWLNNFYFNHQKSCDIKSMNCTFCMLAELLRDARDKRGRSHFALDCQVSPTSCPMWAKRENVLSQIRQVQYIFWFISKCLPLQLQMQCINKVKIMVLWLRSLFLISVFRKQKPSYQSATSDPGQEPQSSSLPTPKSPHHNALLQGIKTASCKDTERICQSSWGNMTYTLSQEWRQ